ncbi:transcript variant X4 [Nothobranchius furzeri]|uniref:Transcript variant X4 n=1 Tax=Nothobranchius furzeri TaxID=105023 RepID=A0A9D2YFI5_NOTFU|nr:transcript variant X4 [Nothobranchius furzeri]
MKMVTLQALGLAWLMCGLVILYETRVDGQSQNNNVPSEAQCGGKSYKPDKETCCGEKNLTEGLSESMSQCCGLEAYNPLNQICCKQILHIKHSPFAKCCGQEQYDSNLQLCCGKYGNMVVRTKLSPDHECCLSSQYNLYTECCCIKNQPLVQPRSNNTCCCEKNLTKYTNATTETQWSTREELQQNIKPDNLLQQYRSERVLHQDGRIQLLWSPLLQLFSVDVLLGEADSKKRNTQ